MSIEIAGLSKTFNLRRGRKALDDVSLSIADGELIALLGASGSGKSTLLRHCAGLVRGDAGSIHVDGKLVQRDGRIDRHVRAVRAKTGFIFQQFNLVGRLSVLKNVLAGTLHRVPLWRSLSGCFTRKEKIAAMAALDRVGMAEFAGQRASTLSGGQQQRVAIARALVQGARAILGDEPIASLDPTSSRQVMETLCRINREDGVTVVVSLHQVDFALDYCPRAIALKDGHVVFDGASALLTPALLDDLYRRDRPITPEAALPAAAMAHLTPVGATA
mgnify:CR=1 FL=1